MGDGRLVITKFHRQGAKEDKGREGIMDFEVLNLGALGILVVEMMEEFLTANLANLANQKRGLWVILFSFFASLAAEFLL